VPIKYNGFSLSWEWTSLVSYQIHSFIHFFLHSNLFQATQLIE